MLRRIGLITDVFNDGTAEVITDRQGGCAQSHGCRSCLSGAKLASTVQNPIGATPGDVVAIEITGKGLWTGALLFYVFPILCLILGAAVGGDLRQVWFLSEKSTPIIFGMLGLGIGLSMTILISRSRFGNSFFSPKITNIVEKFSSKDSENKPILKRTPDVPCCSQSECLLHIGKYSSSDDDQPGKTSFNPSTMNRTAIAIRIMPDLWAAAP